MLLAVDVGNTQTALGLFRRRGARRPLPARDRPEPDGRRARRHALGAARPRRRRRRSASRRRCRRCSASGSASPSAGLQAPLLVVGPGTSDRDPDPLRRPARGRAGPDRRTPSPRSERYGAPVHRRRLRHVARTSTSSRPTGEYVGGVLAPGIEVSMDALFARAARLVKVDFAAPADRDREDDRRRRSSPGSSTASPARWTGSSAASAASSASTRRPSPPAASQT